MKVIPIKQVNKELTSYEIIGNKVIDHSEIVVNFFDYCNMKCSFCPQDHSDKQGTTKEEILSKTKYILDYVNENQKTKSFFLHLMGGELFQDDLIDDGILNHFDDFIDILEKNKRHNSELSYNFITNLIFDNTTEVLKFLKKNNLKINISYDPTGRFNKEQFIKFKNNVEIFKSHINLFSCVMTQKSMEKIIEGDDYFDYLYKHFDCHWDHLLVGDEKIGSMLPTEKEITDFYIHLVKHYPDVINVRQFFEKNKDQKMSCTRGNSLTIFSDNSIPLGCSGSVILKNSNTSDNWSNKIVHNFLEENMCLSCEYYSRCNLTCFIHNDYKNLVKNPQGCPYKLVFEYVQTAE